MNIYYVTSENAAYLENGTKIVEPKSYNKALGNLPVFLHGNKYQVNWQNVTTKGTGAPSTWTKDTTYAETPVLATLVFENNYLHCFRSSLTSIEEIDESSSESLSDSSSSPTHVVEVSISGKAVYDILRAGSLLFFDVDGAVEKIDYLNREKTATGFKFYTVGQPEKNYPAGSTIGIPEAFYAQGVLNIENSNISNGLFSFDVFFFSDKLNNEMLFGGQPYINISYMAMRILSDDLTTEESEYLTSARINNSVSGIRNLRFNNGPLYYPRQDIVFILRYPEESNSE